MVKRIIGGVIVMAIGGGTYTISQSDIAKNFSQNTGLSQQQAQQYVNNIKQSDLESFSKVGHDLVSDGNDISNKVASIDCVNYTYTWVSASLSCEGGKNQLQQVGDDEITLGNCYSALDTNLGNSAKPKISECISDIDTVDADYDLPIVSGILDSNTVSDIKNKDIYNKSELQAALNSH